MLLEIATVFVVVTALSAYLNQRLIGLPIAIGVMAIALGLSLLLLALNAVGIGYDLEGQAESLLRATDFSAVVLDGMLSVLLFAGALHIDLSELRAYRWPVAVLAGAGTLCSAFIVAGILWLALPFTGLQVPFVTCLVFGTLISPTDPIAVLGILRAAGAPAEVELVITGESLFNDGVAVVLFGVVAGALASGATPSAAGVAELFLREAGGGLVLGLALGYVTFRLLRGIDQYQVEVMLTVAAVVGGYALAQRWGLSGPLTVVVAGVVIGNHGRAFAMSGETRRNLDLFWELLDEIFNAVLFALIGLEVLVIRFVDGIALAAAVAIAAALFARALAVGVPVAVLHRRIGLPKGAGTVLTWGGLRGGIAVALALSLPAGRDRELVVPLTYCVVVFSVLVQGLTIRRVVRRSIPCA